VLTKGFAVASTYFVNLITPIFEILNVPGDTAANAIFIAWEESTYHTIEFDLFVDYMLNITQVLKNFIIYISNDYIDSMEST